MTASKRKHTKKRTQHITKFGSQDKSYYEKNHYRNITVTLLESVSERKREFALRDATTDEDYTYAEVDFSVRKIAGILVRMGIRKGDRCAIFSFNCPKWVLMDLAIQYIGAVSVPIYWRSSKERITYILKKVRPKLLFVGDGHLYNLLRGIKKDTQLSKIISLTNFTHHSVLSWDKFLELPEGLCKRKTKKRDLARIVFTSGSTGQPKGVMLSHENLCYEVQALQNILYINKKDTFLSYLPLNHMFGLIGEVYTPLYGGAQIYFSHNPHKAFSLLPEIKPSFFLTVPFVLEKIYKKILEKLEVLHIDYFFRDLDEGKTNLVQKLLFKKISLDIAKKLGGNLRAIVSGGAHLSKDVELFFHYLHLPLYQGYGMTEASPVVALNNSHHHKLYSVGMPLDKIRVSKKGEVLIKGKNVMLGYYKEKNKTKKALSGGWLHTGDIGTIDHYGHLYIYERQDDLIVLSKGKNVNPLIIEERIEEIPEVFKSIVCGHNKPHLVTLLFVEEKATRQLRNKINKQLKYINTYLPHYERIQNFEILPASYIKNSKTLKISRKKTIQQFSSHVEKLYNKKEI